MFEPIKKFSLLIFMFFISHRGGNIDGINQSDENKPSKLNISLA